MSWATAHLERMKDHFANPRCGAKYLINHPPSDYFNVGEIFVGREGNESFLGPVVAEVGENLFIFSSDYPHADRSDGTARHLSERADISEPLGKDFWGITRAVITAFN